MKTKLDTRSLIFGALAGLIVTFTVAATIEKTAPTWEYKVVTGYAISRPSDPSYCTQHEQQLNSEAGQGWEVVCSHTLITGETVGTREIVLRRVKGK